MPTDVTFSQGKATYNGSSTIITNNNYITGMQTIRIKFNSGSSPNSGYFWDSRSLGGTTFIRTNGNIISFAGFSTVYLNNVITTTNSAILDNTDYEFVGVLTSTENISGQTFGIQSKDSFLFDGNLDFFEVYNRALTANEAKNLYEDKYHKGIPIKTSAATQILNIDSSLGGLADRWGNVITNTAVTTVRDGDIYAQLYDGADSKLDTGSDLTGTKDVTLAAWVKVYSYGEGSNGMIFNNGKLYLSAFLTGNRFINTSDGAVTFGVAADDSIILNVWQLICITRTSSGATNFYVDGVLSGSANQDSGTPAAGTTNIIIGNNNGQTETFDGLINAVRIYDGLLSAQEISQIYTSEKERYVK